METGAHRGIGVADAGQLRVREAGAERAANEARTEDARPRDAAAAQLQLSDSAREQAQPLQDGSQLTSAGLNAATQVSAANEIEAPPAETSARQVGGSDALANRGAAQIEIGSEARRLAEEASVAAADVGNNRRGPTASPEREVAEQRIDMPAAGSAGLDAGVSEDELGVVTDAGLGS